MINIHMMSPATGHWVAVYQDAKSLPIAAWALVQESGAKAIVGLVTGENDGALIPADNVPGFVRYKRLWF